MNLFAFVAIKKLNKEESVKDSNRSFVIKDYSVLILKMHSKQLRTRVSESTSRLYGLKAQGKISGAYHEASKLTGPLTNSNSTVFYTHTNCPYAHRVWMTLLEKVLILIKSRRPVMQEIGHELVHVDLSAKPSWFYKINPNGLVPALYHENSTQVESLQICSYIEESMEGPELMPKDPRLRTEAFEFLHGCGEYVSPGLSLIGGSNGQWAITRKLKNYQIEAFEKSVEKLSFKLEEHNGPFLFGKSPTLVDFALFPFYSRFRLVLSSFFGYKIKPQRIIDWLDAMNGRDSSLLTSPDEELLEKAYRRHERLDFFDYSTYTLEQLHPQLVVL